MERYVCGGEDSPSVFKGYVDSMNCNMMASMTTMSDQIPTLFCRQMIPHHESKYSTVISNS
jgi:uncharacterized protein (DUF305 family)